MALLLAILQPIAHMVLQQPMPAAEMALAEAAVPDYPLRSVLALLERTPDLLGRHAAAQRERDVDYGFPRDIVGGEGSGGGGEVFASVHETEV